MAGSLAVDDDGHALFRLGLVDGGLGSGVDHHVRPHRLEPSENSPAILEQEYAVAKQDDLNLAPRRLDQRGCHLTHRRRSASCEQVPGLCEPRRWRPRFGYVHAPRAHRTTSNVFRQEDALQKLNPARHCRLAAAANKSPGDYAVSLFSYSPQQASRPNRSKLGV